MLVRLADRNASNRNRRARQKAFKRCQTQPDQCRAVIAEVCAALPIDPAQCAEAFAPCCNSLANCSVAAALTCLFAAAPTP
jgi:hypothetical protein